VSSAADLLADTTAISAVALAIPVVVVGGDAGNISVMALAVTSAVEGGAILAVASAIPTAAVGGDAGKIPTMASAMASAVDAEAIPAVALAIPTEAVGGYGGKIPTVALAMYAAADAVAIPVAAIVGEAGSESIAAEDDTINGMMPTMMWEDDSRVGDGGDVHDDACSTDSFSGFSDPGGQFSFTNESVHYHHRSGSHLLSDGYSCHGLVEQVKLDGNLSQSVSVSVSSIIPPWVHVFAKSTKSTSLRTQAASIAYIEEPLHKKAQHRHNRRAKKKQEKQHRLLTEAIVPESISPNLLTDYDIYNYIVVVDGGDLGNPSIRPPDGVTWRPISVMKGEHIYVQDKGDPLRGLTFTHVDGVRPFITSEIDSKVIFMGHEIMKLL